MTAENQKIACDVCKREIPKAAALHPEGEEYVLNFCSIECLDYWKQEQKKAEPEKSKK